MDSVPFDFSLLTSSRPPRPLVIAEIGTAHGGDLVRGLELVDAAADAGADVAKTQVVFADEILPPQAGLVPLPGGDTPLYDVFRSLEEPPEFYAALAERARARNIGFLASPFGERSVRLLQEIGVRAWKVASPELNHEDLLELLARTGLPLILSTGVSTNRDIARALEVIAAARPADRTASSHGAPAAPVVLLHCLTSYPAPENEANLLLIPSLAAAWGVPAGLSDHSLDPVLLPALAAALGAAAVEKHITLDRSGGGLDDPVALTPGDFERMTAAIRRFALPDGSGGHPAPVMPPPTHPPAALLPLPEPAGRLAPDPAHLARSVDELSADYGRERVLACLGDGVKRLADSESANYGRTNRSLHAVGALAAGTVLTPDNSAILRTEKVLRPGIEPRDRRRARGRVLVRDVPAGEGITWDDLGGERT